MCEGGLKYSFVDTFKLLWNRKLLTEAHSGVFVCFSWNLTHFDVDTVKFCLFEGPELGMKFKKYSCVFLPKFDDSTNAQSLAEATQVGEGSHHENGPFSS